MNEAVLTLASALIAKKSITPDDAGCQAILISRLKNLGFTIETMNVEDTQNFLAFYGDVSMPTLLFAGHTDVVPPGEESAWIYPPFTPTIHNGLLYGRGAVDMKSSLAAMICATERYISDKPRCQGRIGFLVTSDEEGSGRNGTIKVVEELQRRNEHIDYCIVGEPTSQHTVGDQIKNGRRGSLIGHLTIQGKQGHVAYPHLANNPIHASVAILNELLQTEWDNGNAYFPKTTVQIVSIQSDSGANNVIPGELQLRFSFRYGTTLTDTMIKRRVEAMLAKHESVAYQLKWHLSGKPFLTAKGTLTNVASEVIYELTNQKTNLSTSGGTSDGRFIAQLGCEIIEIGLPNTTIHQINEHVAIDEIVVLERIYNQILTKLFGQ